MFTSSKVSVSRYECLVGLYKARFEANATTKLAEVGMKTSMNLWDR